MDGGNDVCAGIFFRIDVSVLAQELEVGQAWSTDFLFGDYPELPAFIRSKSFGRGEFRSIFFGVSAQVVGVLYFGELWRANFTGVGVRAEAYEDVRGVATRNARQRDGHRLLFKAFDFVVELQEQHVFLLQRGFETFHPTVLAAGKAAGDGQVVFGDFADWHAYPGCGV